MNNIFTLTLKNKLKVMTIELPKTELFYINVIINAGSSNNYQKDNEAECAHFLEHIYAKLTSKKYPNYEKTKNLIDYYGIYKNASTSLHFTKYLMTGNIKDKKLMMDILLNTFTNFKFNDNNLLEIEREAILNELIVIKNKREKDSHVNLLSSLNILKNLDNRIENTKVLTLKNLLDFRDRYYVPNNMKIIIAGDVKHKDVFEYISKFFTINNNLKNREIYSFSINLKFNPFLRLKKVNLNKKTIFYKKIDNSSTNIFIYFYFNNIKFFSKDKYIISYITNILQKELFKVLRYKYKKIYGISVYEMFTFIDNFCLITISTSVRNISNVKLVTKIILDKVNDFISNTVSNFDYNKTKNYLKNIFLSSKLDNNIKDYVSKYITYFLYNKDFITDDKNYKMLTSVSKKDIFITSRKIFNFNNMIIHYYGPNKIKF